MTTTEKLSLIGQVLAFGSFLILILKYIQEKRKDFQRRFFEEQLKTYSEAVDNASAISINEKGSPGYVQAVLNFKRLYWGKMCVIEDSMVESQMGKFYKILDKYEKAQNSNHDSIRNELQQAGLRLAHTCRNSTLRTWGITKNLDGYNNYSIMPGNRVDDDEE